MIRRIKHAFIRLSAEEKVTLFGALAILLGAFMPWYEVELSVSSKTVTESGFSGDLGVIGLAVFLIALLAVLILMGEHLRFHMPTFGYKKEKVMLFFMGQSTFLLLLTLLVYTKRSFDFTSAHLRFGLYLALIGAFVATIAAYATLQRLKKREVEAFFDHPETDEDPALGAAALNDGAFAPRGAILRDEETAEDEAEEETQMQLEDLDEVSFFETPGDDAAEEDDAVTEISIQEIREEAADDDQGNYFTREAGLGAVADAEDDGDDDETEDEPEAPEEDEPEESPEDPPLPPPRHTRSFYDD